MRRIWTVFQGRAEQDLLGHQSQFLTASLLPFGTYAAAYTAQAKDGLGKGNFNQRQILLTVITVSIYK